MDGVTDTVFRQIVASVAKPDVFFTEFVPVDALLSEGKEKALEILRFEKTERPIVAQIWGSDPEKFFRAAQIVSKLGFDGIDINMGCPDRSAVKNGACAALINTPLLATDIINATIKGASGLPVSVKTRIGFREIITEDWIKTLLQTQISALTVHLRTKSEMSKPPAHWEEMSKIVKLRNQINPRILIIGNGDIKSAKEAQEKCKMYGIEGVMIGRGIFENIGVFNRSRNTQDLTPKEKIGLLVKHLELFNQTYEGNRPFEMMKKFVKCYVNNFKGATDAREKLMKTKNIGELIEETKKQL